MPFRQNFFGFTSIYDFIHSAFGFHWAPVNAVVATVFATITTFLGAYIWETPSAVYTLWSLMAFDWVTGIGKAIKFKQFSSFRLWRMPIYFVTTTLILSISFWMAQGQFLFTPLPSIVIGGFYSVYFISILENLGKLEYLPKPMINLLKNRFGIQTLIDHYSKNEETQDK